MVVDASVVVDSGTVVVEVSLVVVVLTLVVVVVFNTLSIHVRNEAASRA